MKVMSDKTSESEYVSNLRNTIRGAERLGLPPATIHLRKRSTTRAEESHRRVPGSTTVATHHQLLETVM